MRRLNEVDRSSLFASIAAMQGNPLDLDAARAMNVWDLVAAIQYMSEQGR